MGDRPRLLVLTDIGGDPDDQQSMIRLMVNTSEFEIEGLVASASGTPGELGRAVTRPDLIEEVVSAYGEIQPNLARHDGAFPPLDGLLAKIRSGNSSRGREAVGEDQDTDGSRLIVEAVDRDDQRPLNIVIWGGQTDLAQALWRARKDGGSAGLARFVSKLRIHDINDQDGILSWMVEQFPGMFYILSSTPPGCDKRLGAYRGMYLGGDQSLTSREWIDENVRTGHGPLGALYPTKTWTAPNPHSTLKEGDTPSWFYFLPNGLGDPAHPGWGSWGGRFERTAGGLYRDAADTVDGIRSARAAVWRWRGAFQREFAARMDWCVVAPAEASHPPRVVLNGDGSRRPVRISADAGESVQLSADGSHDPDGGDLTFRWWHYPEAGTPVGPVPIEGADGKRCEVAVPPDAAGAQIHVILEATNTGGPPLTRYRRAVLSVEPAG